MDPHAATYGRLATAGIIGQALLVLCAWLLPVWSRFGLLDDRIGALVLGRNGWAMGVTLALGSLGAIAIATAVHGLTRGTPGAGAGTVLLWASGVAGAVAAVFLTDGPGEGAGPWDQSLTGRIHLLAMGASLIAGIAGTVVLGWVLSADRRWRLSPWPALLATAALAMLVAEGVALASGSWSGLFQRLLITVLAAWLVLAAVRARQLASGIVDRISVAAREDTEILAEIAAELEHPVRR